MVHVPHPYRIPRTIGILCVGVLCALAGCGGDAAKQAEVDALRQEVATLKQAQAESQKALAESRQALAALEKKAAAPAKPLAAAKAGEAAGDAGRSPLHVIPIAFSPRKGNEITAITVVEFADFQCPYCQQAAGLSGALLKEFPNDVKFVFKHYPLGRHADAFKAATASWAAHQQGKFWEMHDLIYRGDIAQLPVEKLRGYAEQLGLDMPRFDEDMKSLKAAQAVTLDKQLGKRIKVGGTPAYFVNGKRFDGRSPAALRALIAQEIADRKPGAEPAAQPSAEPPAS